MPQKVPPMASSSLCCFPTPSSLANPSLGLTRQSPGGCYLMPLSHHCRLQPGAPIVCLKRPLHIPGEGIFLSHPSGCRPFREHCEQGTLHASTSYTHRIEAVSCLDSLECRNCTWHGQTNELRSDQCPELYIKRKVSYRKFTSSVIIRLPPI